ncbi:MAG: Hsp20/alpha crystallin family protein [Halioglobus sp.]
MTKQQNITTQSEPAATADNEPRLVLRPAVDIFENGDAIKLFADLPGVADNTLSLEIDDQTLTLQGDIALDMPGDIESLYADIRSTHYQRAFTLSSELDTARIHASLANGVLTVTIPKREEVRPRKIEVTAG